MTVPFDQLGDGQVGRMVYQVIGKDGPVFNPDNIKYLAPDEAQRAGLVAPPGTDLAGLAAGMAGLNLMVSMGTLGLSAATLDEVKKISRKLDQVAALQIETLDGIERIYQRLSVIDIKVSENNLRHALNHVASSCIRDNSIDLLEIRKLENDLTNFMLSVDGWGYGSHAFFSLSSDVRDKLTGLHSFLFKLRETVARRHNIKAGGHPCRMLAMHPIDDYCPTLNRNSGCLRLPVIMRRLDDDLREHAVALAQAVYDKFFFASEEAKQTFYELVIGFGDNIWKRVVEIDFYAADMFNGLHTLTEKGPENLDNEDLLGLLNNWENYWLIKTDMGLVWRTWVELSALGDYRSRFRQWRAVEPRPLGANQLLVDCTWKKSA